MKRITAVLAAVCLWAIVCVPTTGCNGVTVAQDIVAWTPTIVSAAATIDATVATLDPVNAPLIIIACVSFTAAANLVDAAAKTYLANPNATALQQLQAQALSFQGNVTTALLQAARITNAASQQKITMAINAAVTGISAILALITTIKGSTLSPSSVVSPTIAQVLPLMDERQTVALVAEHYSEPQFMAAYRAHQAERVLAQAGL